MKVKTSITISEELLHQLNKIHNRSAFIEKAIKYFFNMQKRKKRDQQDYKILNYVSKKHSNEIDEIMDFQGDL